MARLPDELIQRLKSDVSLQRLVEGSGVDLKPHGADWIGHCPFHDDKTPSLVVSPSNNLWHCLGACQTGGSVIDWVMRRQGVSFRHAVELLRDDPSTLAAAPGPPVKKSTTQKMAVLLSEDAEARQLLDQVTQYYHETLLACPEALEYLQQRGLGDPELINRFRLGYANRTLGYRLPAKTRKAGAAVRGKLQEVGLLRASGHEHFSGSLIVPILDANGQVVEIYGRKVLGNRLRKGTAQHLYLPGPHAGAWNAEGLADHSEVILCEALLDAMTFWVAGYRNVTASYGTSGFTEDHLALFKHLGTSRILIAYDRDEAGNQAAEQLAKKLAAEGFACCRLLFPKGMDANAYALEVRPANKSLGIVIRSAQWMGPGDPPQSDLPLAAEPLQPAAVSEPPVSAPVASTAPPATVDELDIPATAVPPAPVPLVEPEVSDQEVVMRFGERRYRVRGLNNNTSYEVLKVNVLLQCGEVVHVDTLDLYSAKHRQAFARVAASELGVEDTLLQRDLGQLLLQLETLQDAAIQAALLPNTPTSYTLDAAEREQALALLRDPHLITRLQDDFVAIGLVGEPTNALMGYLGVVSRKLPAPLAIIVQSTSAAGKSALMDAVLKLVPEEDKVHYSAMTGQSLFYLGETDLKHKVLGISEEEGVRQAAYALKLLQSQGELTIASTGKDPQSGKLVTEEYRVEGPVMLFLTTTAIDIDEELLNRCVVLTINESREQTAAIQQRQRAGRTLSGLLATHTAEQCIQQHRNAQRLLRPLAVVNPYAEQLCFADSRTRTRRDHQKYLTLIDSIALLHQYQREIKTVTQGDQVIEYIDITREDIALANQLAHDVLGRSLDELPPPTRTLLGHLYSLVDSKINEGGLRRREVRFTRREVREAASLSDTQVRVHLERLVALEYVLVHYGKNGQRYVYELVFDGEPEKDQPQLMGLIDVATLRSPDSPDTNVTMITDPAVSSDTLAGSLRTANGALAATLPEHQKTAQASAGEGLSADNANNTASLAHCLSTPQKKPPSYRTATLAAEG